MRSLAYVFTLASLACWNTSPCLAQQPSGPRTLENLLNSGDAQKPAAAAEAEPTDAGSKRPSGTVMRPKEGVQHPDLDKAWADYDAAVTKAAEGIRAAINKQFDAATAMGDLDAAEKWQVIGEKFEKAGELPTEKETEAAVSRAASDYKKAREEITKAYEAVVKSLTIEKKIAEAKAAREESRALGRPENWPKKGMYEFVQSDRNCLLFEVGHDTITTRAYKEPGKPWGWNAKPQAVQFRVSDGILYADGVDEGTEHLRWDITSNSVERDWYWAERRSRGTQKGTIAPSDLTKP